jgi:cytochrome c553
MKKLRWMIGLAFLAVFAASAWQQQSGKDLSWAFQLPDKTPPPSAAESGPKQVPGSSKSYTQAQIDDLFAPPDWFPDEHAPAAPIVLTGKKPTGMACGSCHLMSGRGHPESADLAGMAPAYIARQMAEFKSGARKDAAPMNAIAQGISDDDARQASQWFASLKPTVIWTKVVEADTVPKTWVNRGRMRFALPGGGTEPLGNRIITVPQDPERIESRDPHIGFIAYVPFGSLKKGEALVKTGGSGKTIQCGICHGPDLKGLGEVPRIAGVHPIYIARQLYNFKSGANGGGYAPLMKQVVAQLSDEDIVALAAYVGSQAP